MKNHIWMLSCRYKCKSCVGPIWWIIDYPASLEHRTNRLDVGREWGNRQENQQTSPVTLNSASTIALSWTSTSNSTSNYHMMMAPFHIVCISSHLRTFNPEANSVKKFGLGQNPLPQLGQNPIFLTASKCYKEWECFLKIKIFFSEWM